MIAVMCCGCWRFLGADESLIQTDGLVQMDKILDFADAASADRAAQKAGWSVKDSEGPNHRCPDCRVGRLPKRFEKIAPEWVERHYGGGRGAFVPSGLLRGGGGKRGLN